jgi:hypothetical protein
MLPGGKQAEKRIHFQFPLCKSVSYERFRFEKLLRRGRGGVNVPQLIPRAGLNRISYEMGQRMRLSPSRRAVDHKEDFRFLLPAQLAR